MFEVHFLGGEVDQTERMSKDKLDMIMKHRPIIEVDSNTYRIDNVHYDVDSGKFFVMITEGHE